MPYRIIKKDNVYKLFNLTKKEYVNKNFKTRESAIKSGFNYMRYRKEEPITTLKKEVEQLMQDLNILHLNISN